MLIGSRCNFQVVADDKLAVANNKSSKVLLKTLASYLRDLKAYKPANIGYAIGMLLGNAMETETQQIKGN